MSKFVVMPGPQFYPGKTVCCGKTTGPVIDFGVVEEFGPRDGAVYFCVDCIVEAALQTHLVVKPVKTSNLSEDAVAELSETLGRLHAVFANGSSDVDRARDLISSVGDVSLASGDAKDDSGAITVPDLPTFNSDQFALGEGPISVPADSSDERDSIPAFGI